MLSFLNNLGKNARKLLGLTEDGEIKGLVLINRTKLTSTSSVSDTIARTNPAIFPIRNVLAQEIVEDLEAAVEQNRSGFGATRIRD